MSEVERLKNDLKNKEELVARAKLARKLATNREFKELIMKDYMVDEASRLVHMSADPILPPEHRADALAMAQASGHLKRYLSVVVQMGDVAGRDIEQINEAILEAEEEEAEGA